MTDQEIYLLKLDAEIYSARCERLKAENRQLKDTKARLADDLDTTNKLLSNAERELKAYKKSLKWALKQLGKKEAT